MLGNISGERRPEMRGNRPNVEAGRVYDPVQLAACIWLDTPAWQAWLDAATTTSFSYPLYDPACGSITGWMTVRKERR